MTHHDTTPNNKTTPVEDSIDEIVRDCTSVEPRAKSEIRRRIESLITLREERARGEIKELVDALESMYDQYCDSGHDFMSAGEGAESVLRKHQTTNVL